MDLELPEEDDSSDDSSLEDEFENLCLDVVG
jgi:hypothetical protein